jgi:Zn-dependent peptidase ImmA (M78 family)/transcriptional regulator with XRE-family HTH domain
MLVDRAELGRRLREARANCDISQDDVAKALKLPRAVVVQIENGERTVTMDQLAAFASLYRRQRAEFVAEDPEELLVALLRAAPDLEDRDQVEANITRHVTICRIGAELEALVGLPVRSGPPAYDLPAPLATGPAIEQGHQLARQERLRLGLGDNPVPDVADLIAATGIWASGAMFPDAMSGVFLRHPSIGMVILVNYKHPRVRKRFSYAHEYAHALLDRSHTATISTDRNRTQLLEVRANAFAAAFLLPSGGVNAFLRARRKGLQSKQEAIVYDPTVETAGGGDALVRTTVRTAPGSQKITYQDVAALAHRFGTSYQAAAYRLRSLWLVNDRELQELLEKQDTGREYLQLLHFQQDLDAVDDDPRAGDRELIGQVIDLALEAYRRDLIPQSRILEIGTTLGIGGRKLVALADAAK